MVKGISAVASAVNAFHEQCPDTKLVLVGYSQGGQSKYTPISYL
jgi:acetylxylan esterase